jgi:hypothetical protein
MDRPRRDRGRLDRAGDDLGTWTFDWHTLAVAGDLAFVQGRTTYTTPPNYRNLWVIRFDAESRAVEFTEWFMRSGDRRTWQRNAVSR